jgi:hypothetical protein
MLKSGLATVYEAKTGAEFGALEAGTGGRSGGRRRGGRGWGGKKADYESPRDYKTRVGHLEEAKEVKK